MPPTPESESTTATNGGNGADLVLHEPPTTEPPTAEPPRLPNVVMRGLVGVYLRIMAPCTEAPLAFHFAVFITIAGLFFGRRAYVFQGMPIYPNFFSLLVAPTGKARKSTAQNLGRDHLVRYLFPPSNEFYLVSGAGSGEGLLERVADLDGRGGRKLLFMANEFSTLLRKMRQGDRSSTVEQFLIDAADAASPMTLTTRKNAVVATNALVAMTAATTEAALDRDLDRTLIETGLLNRVLFFTGPPGPRNPRPPEPDADQLQDLRNELVLLQTTGPKGRIEWASSAQVLWDDWYRELGNRKYDDPSAEEATARVEQHAARLALLYAMLDGASELRLEHVEAGVAVAEYSAGVAVNVVTRLAASQKIRMERLVLDAIARATGVDGWAERRKVQQALSGRVAAQDFHAIMTALQRGGLIDVFDSRVRIRPQP